MSKITKSEADNASQEALDSLHPELAAALEELYPDLDPRDVYKRMREMLDEQHRAWKLLFH